MKYIEWVERSQQVKTNLGATGKVIGYQSNPTLIIEKPDGEQFHWAADLCEEVTDEEREAN